jgi:methylmalonyl-CoA mutase
MADLSAWRALVAKELAGASFDKLVQRTPEGVSIEPLYVDRPAELPCVRDGGAWKLCVRVEHGGDVAPELDGGADALWCAANDRAAIELGRARGVPVVVDGDPRVVTTLGFHDAGADAADELALGLSSLVAVLRRHVAAGDELARVAPGLSARVAVGRDTFGEVCKLRALRVLWHKVLAGAGVADARLGTIHAVCSARTLSQRDPWVNMLRVTTQVFAAALGGAQLITPRPFDAAFATRSALGDRVARNTALVLREESQLGRVHDAAGGSYYIETRTDALARAAWSRFAAIERDGGVDALARSGTLQARLEAAWTARLGALARRKEPVLGVSEFANLREQLPGEPRASGAGHRDSEAFEALRARVEREPRGVQLALLGPAAEHRARVGFAEALFAVAGLAAVPRDGGAVDIACICGSDERYATEAVDAARALKAAGARRVVVAGKPGALEAALRAAGVDAFIFVGCDVLATFEELLS